ncbi:dedicator of cytokinesis protein 1-like isoform X2 [Daphnia carinata]|uniref:dedicator of cytokinesis protein 1-like isoform X2 n=1 Tax=Daphnia carinata TaxID=120202 RepID=UPI002868DC1B|nr:dedicator of cytokinesis protein 1-like isoform X2 [Daphnia carinata]
MTHWIPTPEKDRLGVVTYNFQHDGTYCLKLEVGDTVHNLCQDEFWYFGYTVRNRALKGIYPKSFIHIQESFIEKTAVGEQVTACQSPVVQEVTSVLREWGQIGQELYRTHDHKWRAVYLLMRDLMANRSKMLTGTLTLDELRELKQSLTSQIDFGNNLLGLDMVVRDEHGNVLNPDAASVVQLYRHHEQASQRIKKAVASSNNVNGISNTGGNGLINPIKIKLANRHSHMFFVAVRNFVCRVGEDTELLLCLYDAKEWKPLTENYVLRWSRMGLSMDLDLLGNMRVLYTDLGSRDLARERIYLVCYVIRVGNMDIRPEDPRRQTTSAASMGGSRRTISGNLPNNSAAPEFLRRPCGIACMDVTDYLSGRLETDEEKQHFVPFISCSDKDSLDGTLRRLIVSGREVGHKEHKNQGLWVSLRLLHGDMKQVSEEHPALVQVAQVAVSRKLGFPEIILPGDVRHDLYLTLSSGEFSRGSKSADKNVEVTVRVCNEKGKPIPGVMHLGSGVVAQDEYRSVVYYHEDKPRWNETFKIAIPIDEFYRSHLKFTFKHRSSNEAKDRTEKPFALSYVKLMQDNGTTLMDTQHELLVYKVDHRKLDENETAYLGLPSTRADIADCGSTKPSAAGLTINMKDSLLIGTCLCSTKLTQNVELLGLLKYHSSQSQQLPAILSSLMKVDGEEVVKFLQDVLDALFNILMLNSDSNIFDRSVFDCLVFIIGLVTDRKYEHFKPVLDVYIKDNFSATLAYKKLLVVLNDCVQSDVTTKGQGDDLLRVMKALQYLFKFIVRSRQLYVNLHGEVDEAGDSDFESLVLNLLSTMSDFMRRNDGLVLLAQGACLKYIPCAIPDLVLVIDEKQLSTSLADIVTSVPAGRLNNQKMMTLNDMVHSQLFLKPECRAIILPVVVKRVKELLTGPQEVEMSVTVMCDVMQILHRKDVGATHNDVAEVMANGLRTIIQTIISIDREDPFVGHLVSVMLSIFRQMTPHHYRNYLGHFNTRSDLLDFLIEILMVFKDLVAKHVYAPDWAQMILLQNSIILKALRFFSHTIRDRFSNPYEGQLWNNYFFCAITYVCQPALQMESFSQTKKRQVMARYRDMRREMGFEIRTMWFNLGQHKINFVPAIVGQFLEMALLPETELRKATIPIFFDMMQCEFYSPRVQGEAYSDTKRDSSHIKGNFQDVENKLITQLDVLVEGGRGDEHYKDLFQSLMTELCEKHSTMRDQGLKLVRTVTRLMERLLEYRSIITDENRENRMSCTVNLLNFYQEIGRKEMYIRYLNKLCDLHLECDNFTEAAYTLQLHAQLLRWSEEPLPTLLLTSRHPHTTSHRQLKEALYLDSVDLFDRGKMWECALSLCKELARQYEEETYDYGRLAALLNRMAMLYDHIIHQLRPEPEYFRVAFYGRGFPAFLQNKIFVFRGKEYERLSDFANRIMLQFPNAETMNRLTPPDQEIMDSPQQYLQMNKVDPMLSAEDQERFGSKPVSEQILRFYRVNRVQRFSFSRPFHRGQRDSDNAFSSLWLERTILTTSHQLPGILRWFPVVDSHVFELSPLQTAIETMEQANKSLTELILAHRADPKLALHPLSMKLNGIVDAAVNGGINNYEKAFFTDRYLLEHPEDAELVSQLQELFALQIPLLEAALVVHRSRVNLAMQPLQQRIEVCFQQMRVHVESKYGRRDVDPQLERQMEQLTRNQRQSTHSTGAGSAGPYALHNRLSANSTGDANHADTVHHLSAPLTLSTSNSTPTSRLSTLSVTLNSSGGNAGPGASHNTQTSRHPSSLFSRTSSQAVLSSLSFSLPSASSNPSPSSISPVKMLTTGHRFRSNKNSAEKKLRDKENKQHRDSFRRLSSSSMGGRGSHFPSLSLAGFGLGGSSTNSLSVPSSPAVAVSHSSNSASSTALGSSAHSLDASSSSETVSQLTSAETTSPVVIELTQQLTAKRPLRSEVAKERRSSTVRGHSFNGDNHGVCSSPSQNSVASTMSSSSNEDVPPPLPAKQMQSMGGCASMSDIPPEKPPLPAASLPEIKEGGAPPPPPKKPARPLPPM